MAMVASRICLAENQNHEPPERTVGSARTVRRLPGDRVTEPAIEFIWHDSPVPAGLPVTQVYGWLLCPVTGRVLIQAQDDGAHSLPGGSPEPYDADMAATLARESFEENQVRIAPEPAYLGYQEVIEPG